MPYPLSRWPSFAEFKGRLTTEFECEFKTLGTLLRNSQGQTYEVSYFERRLGPDDVRRVAVSLQDEEIVIPSVIRSICVKLGINTAAFGLYLG